MSLHPGEYVTHRFDLMADHIFFGEHFRWSPDNVNGLSWSYRKELKEIYTEILKSRAEQMKNHK
jgi:hypothetical protein